MKEVYKIKDHWVYKREESRKGVTFSANENQHVQNEQKFITSQA